MGPGRDSRLGPHTASPGAVHGTNARAVSQVPVSRVRHTDGPRFHGRVIGRSDKIRDVDSARSGNRTEVHMSFSRAPVYCLALSAIALGNAINGVATASSPYPSRPI